MKHNRIKIKLKELGSVIVTEYKHILNDGGVLLILVGALIIYATIYSLAYSNEVLRNIPIAVVDHSQSASSRKFIEKIDAAPNVFVSYSPASMDEAKELFFKRDIYGIVYIPRTYEKAVMRGEQTTIGIYADASYFLMYRQVLSDIVACISNISQNIKVERLLAKGAGENLAKTTAQPIVYQSKNLFNPYLGYGAFIMPAILILIIQQTLLIGIGMIGGTWREFGVYNKLATPGEKRLSTIPIVLGKSIVYLSIYAVTIYYILAVNYKIFNLPANGATWDIVLFLLPYLLSCIFLGIAISTLFKSRESSILFLLWSSIPLLLLSGASLPPEAIPDWMFAMGKVFPSGSGVMGFLRIQTMGGTLKDVMDQYQLLWILSGIYFILACVGIRLVINKAQKEQETNSSEHES